MEIQTAPKPKCLLCGESGDTLYSDIADKLFAVPGRWTLKRCRSQQCGLRWLDPAPVESDLPKLYERYFTHEMGDNTQRLLFRIRSFLYSAYLGARYIPSAALGLQRARQEIQHMFLEDTKPGKLLDVGCGSGVYLYRMFKLGWTATGVDFDPNAIEHAKIKYGSAVAVFHTDLAGAKFPSDSFDAVTMSHVIEHVPDPIELLKECFRVLKPKGRLVITTPNIESFGHRMFRDCWWGLDSPRHLQIFSLAALRACANKAGFRVVKGITTAANADTFIGGSFGFLEAKKTGDGSTGAKVKFNFLRGIRSLLLQYREAILLRHDPEVGEELVLICEK